MLYYLSVNGSLIDKKKKNNVIEIVIEENNDLLKQKLDL